MKNKKQIKISGFKKLVNPFRIVVISEETFEDKFYFKMSILGLIAFSFVFALLISAFTIFIIAYSPIRELIPGYPSTKMRKQAISNTIKIDSISKNIEKQQRFYNAIKSALSGEILSDDISERVIIGNQKDFVAPLKASKEDSILRAMVAEDDRYNIISKTEGKPLLILFAPAKGIVSEKFDFEKKHFAVDIALAENTPIKSVSEGTVIFAEWTADTGYVIIIEHLDGLISVYKHNSSLTKTQGETVDPGEVIASAGNTGELSTGYHLHFELWTDGYPLDPEKFIDFSK